MRASPRLSASFSSSAIASTPTVVADAASSSSLDVTLQEVERCFLRHVIPMRVQGAGAAAALYRHAFLHQESLIQRVLGALEAVPLPALPRMLLAEGFQRMLDGETPQRDIRALFEEAENEARRVLIQAEFHSSVNSQHCDGHFYAAIKTNPLMRLLAYELRAACGYYAQIMSIRSQPEDGAAMLLRTLIAADIRTDPFLVDVMLKFAALPEMWIREKDWKPVHRPSRSLLRNVCYWSVMPLVDFVLMPVVITATSCTALNFLILRGPRGILQFYWIQCCGSTATFAFKAHLCIRGGGWSTGCRVRRSHTASIRISHCLKLLRFLLTTRVNFLSVTLLVLLTEYLAGRR
ncbi:hypothetical protein C4B63_23g261 [Trypanosoma cruzi]|uniref:Uncharacterized protein n=1 Tax=Trypanosoma cruzi TaxID=5693 RepID=A0A2V2VF11_TRYCR|nr:hypothetical protein C4B63_23g261 [Trypanosoma cruzi]